MREENRNVSEAISLQQKDEEHIKYKRLYDLAPSGYFTIERDSTICQLNHSGAKMLGMDHLGLVSRKFDQFVSPDSRPVFDEFLRLIFETNSKQACEVRLTIDESHSLYVHLEGIISDDVQKCLVTGIDITRQKHSEDTIRKSEERHRLLADAALDIIWTMDLKGCYTYVSPSVEKLRGFTVDEVMQQAIEDVLTPKSAAIAQYNLMKALEKVKTGQPAQEFQGELEQRCKDGSTVWTDVTASAMFNKKGEFIGILGVSRNITERKKVEEALRESEEKHRILLDESSDPIFTFNPDGQYRYVNKAFADGVGRKLEEIIGKKIWDVFSKDEADKRFAAVKWVFENAEEKVLEVRVPRPDGDHWYITTVKPILNEIGNVITVICISKDITVRKQAEESLLESEARLRELNATKDKFFSIIAHDLKSPFNSIIGFSRLLESQIEQKNYAGIAKYATIIQQSSQRAMDLLINLLEWSRSQTGRMEFNPETIEIGALINEVAVLLNTTAHQKSITIYTEIPPKAIVFADRDMMGTILRNLISNAIKFTNTGGEIVVSALQNPDDLMIAIKDNGVGLKKEAIEKLFRIDVNYKTMGTQDEQGTGLGLLLCKEFVTMHRGKIWVESNSGNGSKFCFTIPKRLAE